MNAEIRNIGNYSPVFLIVEIVIGDCDHIAPRILFPVEVRADIDAAPAASLTGKSRLQIGPKSSGH
jgi:hypothetical protein